MSERPVVVGGLVSTIIPVFNRAGMLQQAVASVLAQTWRPIEVIVCDDGSTDATTLSGRALEREHPGVVRYLWNPNRGAGPARESGRAVARGEFIQYLDSDDTLWPRKFEVQVAELRARPECGAAYGWIRLCPENGPPIDKPHKWSGRALDTLFPHVLVDRWWNTDAPLWRRSVCDAIGPWSDLRFSQDWEYDARAGALGTRLAYCPEFVTDQRHHEGNRQTGHGRWLVARERVRFFSALLQHARTAGVARDTPEMRHFARWVFQNVRQCGANGDVAEARELFALACSAAGRVTAELRAYRILAGFVGWRTAARASECMRALIARGPGRDTRKQSWMEADGGKA